MSYKAILEIFRIHSILSTQVNLQYKKIRELGFFNSFVLSILKNMQCIFL